MALGRVVVNQNGSRIYTEQLSKTDDARPVPVMDACSSTSQRTARARAARTSCTQPEGRAPAAQRLLPRILRPALQRAGLGERRITWVSLRHTAASLMLPAGLTLFDVQGRLGHRSPVMTAEAYTHMMRERYEEGRAVMERYMLADARP
jgi:site-specific recombinase XerD